MMLLSHRTFHLTEKFLITKLVQISTIRAKDDPSTFSTQDIQVLGGLCQEPGIEIKYVFLIKLQLLREGMCTLHLFSILLPEGSCVVSSPGPQRQGQHNKHSTVCPLYSLVPYLFIYSLDPIKLDGKCLKTIP